MLRFTEILVSLVSRRARTRSSDFYIILHTASLLPMCPGLMSQGVGWDNVHLMPFADTLVKILHTLYSGKFASPVSPKRTCWHSNPFSILEHHCVPDSIF